MKPSHYPKTRWPHLFGVWGFALLLLGSWFWPVTRELWDVLDAAAFYALNGSLAEGESWQRFWAIANYRAFDIVPATLMLGVFVWALRHQDQASEQLRMVSESLAWLVVMLVVILVFKNLLDVGRASASLTLQPVYYLTELVPDIATKDRSTSSFPGDHAAVMLLWAGFLWCRVSYKIGVFMFIVAILFNSPRVVGGAHWLTDNLVGGGFVALIGIGLLCYTPVVQGLASQLKWPSTMMLKVATKLRLM